VYVSIKQPTLNSVFGHNGNQDYAALFELAIPAEKHQFFEMDPK
jgi:hypothetical protein